MLCNTLTCSRQLEKFKIFTAFYHLSELKSREDLIKGIIENLDYSMHVLNTFPPLLSHLFISDGHPRIVLSKALTSSYKVCLIVSTPFKSEANHSTFVPTPLVI